MMSVSAILLLAIYVSFVSGRLVVLRGRENKNYYQHERKLICVSDDDGGGLIWNSNLYWMYAGYAFSDRGGHTNFNTLNPFKKSEIDCDLNTYETCTTLWNTARWTLTNSLANPMGPVFDRRWEGFTEYNNFDRTNEYRRMDILNKTGTLTFSVRGSTDAHMLLCDSDNYETDFCYWIIIGGWANNESKIRKCANGVPHPSTYPNSTTECAQSKAFRKHSPLSATEWKTFTLTWNETTRNISVYDTEELIMTYVDEKKKENNSYDTLHLFFRSPVTTQFRFHIYSFFHTTDWKAILTSPILYINTRNICLQMLIGLCAECDMEILLANAHDESDIESLELITGSTVASPHGLPMWQNVKINKTISNDLAHFYKVMLIPKIGKENKHPFWAAANIRVCPPRGTVRYGVMEATQDYYKNEYLWPNVTCQKLFYNENIVVTHLPNATLNFEFDDLHCPEGEVGPYCSINCYNHLGTGTNCEGTVICEKTGCTCPPGFTGNDCRTYCQSDRYGHDCKETCGLCAKENCNFVTGDCTYGCDNSKRFHIPPLCKTGIDTLPPPEIDFINETTVRVILPAKQEYKEVSSEYVFTLQKEGDSKSRRIEDLKRIFKNTTTLIGFTDDLLPGTSYKISCTLYVTSGHGLVLGHWQDFTTRCSPTIEFEVKSGERNITLLGSQQTKSLYSCPKNWYEYRLENHETGTEIGNGTLSTLPLKFSSLIPNTLYKVIVGKGTAILFSEKIRTLEGVPSEVWNLRKILSSNDELTLEWDPPKYPNGRIMKYEVSLQVQTYFGCSNLNRHTPRDHITSTYITSTKITFSDLHAYAHYIANVTPFNSYRGLEQSIEFDTDQTEIPTAIYSNLRLQNYVLTWDAPRNCTTISGPIVARIVIEGVSEFVNNFHDTRQTKKYYINLESGNKIIYGAQTYRARVYVIRGYNKKQNDLLYSEIIFITPPKAPPIVRNLEIFEIDAQSRIIHLRWQEPQPPINGKIEYYAVANCFRNCHSVLRVLPIEYCPLWKDYVCAAIKEPDPQYTTIAVSAFNVNVSTPGKAFTVPIIRVEGEPEAPENYTIDVLDKGVVNVSWTHPWRTAGHLKKFCITAELISTNLRRQISYTERGTIYEQYVLNYTPRYAEQLHLLPSSRYKISIRAITNLNTYGKAKTLEIQTPLAIAFEKSLAAKVSNADSTISLHIPAVLNDTKNSLMSVIVKGPRPCEYYSKLSPLISERAGIKYYEIAWRAATFPTNEFAGKTFTVGDNKLYDGATNCKLKPEESYMIVVLVQTERESMHGEIMVAKTTSILIGEVPRRHDEAWLIPITIFLVVAATAFFLYRRRRRGRFKEIILQDDMALAHNTENEAKSILMNAKQVLPTPTPSDRDTLSRTSTPDVPIIAIDVSQKEERTSLVKVKDFEDYVRQAINSGLLDKQYDTFPRGQTKRWEYGKLPQNKSKNRYGNLLAYDENRVILKKLPDDPHSDYINANYIKGYKKEKCYIATQGPKSNTVIDFWRMIWQEETLIICMLANIIEGGKAKCEQYWPDIGKKKKYGEVIVLNAKHNVFADYTFRTLHVTCGEETRKIEHLHYTAWPDHGVPLYTHSVVTYLKKILAIRPGIGPVVVHCSAGVGRTGTIILCDICLRRAAAEGVVDVFAETESIRSQRANMVDNKQQYLLAHLALVECLLSLPTALPCNEALPTKIKELKTQLTIQLQRLQNTAWQDEALRPITMQVSLSERNLAKNRFPELVSAKLSRVYLKRYPSSDEDSDYISAVYVDGVRLQNQYLATQLPLPSTFNDFWRMIAEYKVELVVMLQPPDTSDATCCPIVPTAGEFKPTPYMNIKTKDVTEFEFYVSQKLILIDNSEKPAREQQVTILYCTEWKPGKNQNPPPVMTLVTLWQAAERISRGDGPTVVLCHDGVTGCGLYLALNFLLERMAVERECDVCLAVRAVRRSRPDFVRSLEHMEYLYDAALTYLEYFETYANFT